MAKSDSTIVQGLFGGEPLSARADVGSHDTPVVASTPSREHREHNTSGRKPVDVVIGSNRRQEVRESSKTTTEVTISSNKPPEDWGDYQTHQGNHSGQKTRRMCVAMPDDAYRFIRREAIKHGMTYGEYIYSLAQAAAKGEVTL